MTKLDAEGYELTLLTSWLPQKGQSWAIKRRERSPVFKHLAVHHLKTLCGQSGIHIIAMKVVCVLLVCMIVSLFYKFDVFLSSALP